MQMFWFFLLKVIKAVNHPYCSDVKHQFSALDPSSIC